MKTPTQPKETSFRYLLKDSISSLRFDCVLSWYLRYQEGIDSVWVEEKHSHRNEVVWEFAKNVHANSNIFWSTRFRHPRKGILWIKQHVWSEHCSKAHLLVYWYINHMMAHIFVSESNQRSSAFTYIQIIHTHFYHTCYFVPVIPTLHSLFLIYLTLLLQISPFSFSHTCFSTKEISNGWLIYSINLKCFLSTIIYFSRSSQLSTSRLQA